MEGIIEFFLTSAGNSLYSNLNIRLSFILCSCHTNHKLHMVVPLRSYLTMCKVISDVFKTKHYTQNLEILLNS